jgi:2-polyprenyl-6-methoxyphenol hydroxylase-like FAD-dependent oxidoreductase
MYRNNNEMITFSVYRQAILLWWAMATVVVGVSSFTPSTIMMSQQGVQPEMTPSRMLSLSSSSSTAECSSSSTAASSIAKPDTLVVGGGLAGLAAAAALRSIAKMDRVHVIDARKDDDAISNDRAGAAMQLGPNAFKALEAIGGEALLQKIYQEGSKIKENILLLPGGAPPMKIPNNDEEEFGYPTVLIRWGVLRRLLAEMLPEESLLFGMGKEIAGYKLMSEEEDGEESTNTVAPVNQKGEVVSTGSSFQPQLIVGADGLKSVFRECVQNECQIKPKDSPSTLSAIKDNGRVNIKAAVPVKLSELGEQFAVPHATFAQFDPQVACFAGPAGPKYTYWAISIADGENGVPFFSSDNPQEDSIQAKNLVLDKLEQIASDDVSRAWIIELVERTDPRNILINRSLEAPVKEDDSFVSQDGKVVLLGDAAHAMNPSYGQSASFAFEDAATLATCIRDGSMATTTDEETTADYLTQVLQSYSEQRVLRCREMQRRSEERAAKSMRGEKAEDVSKWIYAWEL